MKLSLKTSIISSVAVFALGSAMLAGLGIHGISRSGTNLKGIVEFNSARKDRWFELRNLQTNLAVNEQLYIMDSRPEARRNLATKMENQHKALNDVIGAISQSATGEADDQSGSEKAAITSYQKALFKWWENDLEVRREVEQGRRDYAQHISTGKGRELFESAQATATLALENLGKEMQEATVAAEANTSSSRLWIWLMVVLTLAVGVFNMFAMFKTLYYCTQMISKIITANSHAVEKTARQVAEAASKLSQASTEQASALQETAASAEELSAMVERNQENAKQATNLSNSSQMCAQKGQNVVQDMAKAIYEINSSNQDVMNEVFESNRKISEITKVIAEIGNKTKVINDIVFQTKLLSFNASVEAARAGEHGRGFAVVAEEVGNLARMSGTAAKEIGDMLEQSIHKVDTIVRETKTNVERLVLFGKEKVDAGTRIVGECSQVLDEIVTSITQVSLMSNDISSASDEQAYGVKEISSAVSQLDTVVHGNAVSAEEASLAADGLSGQAKSLQATVNDLLTHLQGGTSVLVVDNKGFWSAVNEKSGKVGSGKPPAKSGDKAARSPGAKSAGKTEKKTNVVELRPSTQGSGTGEIQKKAAGSEIDIPSADDPRFKDI